tara:strand:- start:90 stop:500 length:411 start_codon:yes stop_codon:yes gene_type:complete
MLLLEREILGHLNDNWSETPIISWANFNVSVNYSADTEYLVPFLRNLDSEILETPATTGAVRRDYAMGLNLLLKENTGTSAVNSYVEVLKNLFSKKDVSTTNYLYSFSPLEVGVGFGQGPHFEIPVSVDFYVYSSD